MTESKRILADVLLRPVITEKATALMEQRKYVFEVLPTATKPLIRAAVEEMFRVRVTSVNTLKPPRKQRRVGRFVGYRTRPKRAIVTLAEGDSITLFPDT
ncbi:MULTISPECIES: 50S ribosomal protein L23 [unclassified Synechococcus]|jgi:large subunit ribosomal protein L23|uniref:Large ribosomal subunit protein uL23 n=1 Tax=Synechococcus sp. (strain JA-2-3B'a(2-13)) TaxID=321332 RepID=RL23_SYNJB|nr:50S ribosomal protein L23 [Synechococcus sp. JA-2-3B'a(2-13)]Q2JIM5.1 RecName: Full=Large ribosomal subunit protein uL23; AltName: Full=50S ribosomal protein L23 [Synechococcus sp. JA-2-3B'a(2-13)]ABD03529.1 ribosomal protein L23 [Synechococcus sp. JA-2-3B'a(2-13)]